MKRIVLALCLSAVAVGCSAAPGDPIDDSVDTQQAVASLPLYRSFGGHGDDWDHFYSTTQSEGDRFGYIHEGILGYCEPGPNNFGTVGTVLLHRLYNAKANDHFYTIDAQEAQNATRAGWAEETGAVTPCYVWPVQIPNTCPVYRAWSSFHGDHFYTQSPSEYEHATTMRELGVYTKESTHAWYMQHGDSTNSLCQ